MVAIFLLLDDAASHRRVRPLLPGTAGSLVLVTSRTGRPPPSPSQPRPKANAINRAHPPYLRGPYTGLHSIT
jgi:hypothetical protein